MSEEMREKLTKHGFDKEYFVNLVLESKELRDIFVYELCNHPHIMTYYHCYYVLADASLIKPELFYEYFDMFVNLFDHKNSYHRSIGHELVTNIMAVDREYRFIEIRSKYYDMLNDVNYKTSILAIRDAIRLIEFKDEEIGYLIKYFLNINSLKHTEKQIGVIKYDILNFFDTMLDKTDDYRKDMIAFINESATSVSPKARKCAKEIIKRRGLSWN